MAEKKKLSAREVLADIRAGLDAEALMTKYGLSPNALKKILDELEKAGVASRFTTHHVRSSLTTILTEAAEKPTGTSRETSITEKSATYRTVARGRGSTAMKIVAVLVVIALLVGAAIYFGGPYATQTVKGELEHAVRIGCRQHDIQAHWKSSELVFSLKTAVLTFHGLSVLHRRESILVQADRMRLEIPLTEALLRPFSQGETSPNVAKGSMRNARITQGELPGILVVRRIDLTTTPDEPGEFASADHGLSPGDGVYLAAHVTGIGFEVQKQIWNGFSTSGRPDKRTHVDSVSIRMTYNKSNDTIRVHHLDLNAPGFFIKLRKPIRAGLETDDAMVRGKEGLSRKVAISPGTLEWTSPTMTGTYSFGSIKTDYSVERCLDRNGKRTCVIPIGSQSTTVQNILLKGVERGKMSGMIEGFLLKSESVDWSWNYDGSKLAVVYSLNKPLLITEQGFPQESRSPGNGSRDPENLQPKAHVSASKVALTYDGEINAKDLERGGTLPGKGNHNLIFLVADCSVLVPPSPPGLSAPLQRVLQTVGAERIVFNASLAGEDDEGSITGAVQSSLYSGSFEAKASFPEGSLSRPDPRPENMTFHIRLKTVPQGISLSEPEFPGTFSLKSLSLEAHGGFQCDEEGKPIPQTASCQGRFQMDDLNAVISPNLGPGFAPPGFGLGRDISSKPLTVDRLSLSAKLEGDSFQTEEASLASPYFHADLDAALKLLYGNLEQSPIERFVITFHKVSQNLRPLLGFFTKAMGGPLEPQGDKLVLKATGTVGNPDFGVRTLPPQMIIPRGAIPDKNFPGLKPPQGGFPHVKPPEFPR
jgi:hypothetical protein